jgi:hypothetical protein
MTDGMLPTELGTKKLSVAKARPECLLCIGLVATQSTSSLTLALSLVEGEGISFENAIRISTTVNSVAQIKAT